MKPLKKYLQWLGIAVWAVALVLAYQLYRTYRLQQQFLKEGQRVEAFLGMKSKNWYETKEWFWEVSYWIPSKTRKIGRMIQAKIIVDHNDYYQYEEEERVWVYYLKKKPKMAKLELQLKASLPYQPILWWVIIGFLLIFIARVIL